MRRVRLIAAILAVLAVACGGTTPAATAPAASAPSAGATSAATPTAPPVTVQIGLTSNTQAVPVFVGLEKGIYLKHGIDLKLNITSAGADTIKGLQGGQFQIVTNSWGTITPGIVQGMPAKIIAFISGRPDVEFWDGTLGLIARPGISSIADLKGLTVGAAPGAVDLWLRSHLKRAGVNDKDVKIINLAAPNTLSSIQSKAADAVAAAEPYISQTASLVAGSKILVHGGGAVDARQSIYALEPWIKANPKVVDNIIAANLESQQYVRQHLEETATIASHYLSGLSQEILVAAIKYQDLDSRWSPKILVGWDASTQQLIDQGTFKSAPKAADFLVMDLITSAQTKYPQYFTDLK